MFCNVAVGFLFPDFVFGTFVWGLLCWTHTNPTFFLSAVPSVRRGLAVLGSGVAIAKMHVDGCHVCDRTGQPIAIAHCIVVLPRVHVACVVCWSLYVSISFFLFSFLFWWKSL